MGCHTWTNHRLKHTREQLLVFAAEQLEYTKHHYGKHADTWSLVEKYEAGDRDTIDDLICEYLERTSSHTGYHHTVSARTGMAYTCHFFDIFRVSGYPEDECHSLRETLDFLAARQRAELYIWEDENTMPLLEKFWKEHPQGMITFG